MRSFLKVAIACLLYLALFDVIGVVGSMVLDIAPIRGKTTLLFFTIWFVLGVFVGFLTYGSAGTRIAGVPEEKWLDSPDARLIGLRVIFSVLVVMIALTGICWMTMWRFGTDGDIFVPDNMATTITFFVSTWLGTIAAQLTLPKQKVAG